MCRGAPRCAPARLTIPYMDLIYGRRPVLESLQAGKRSMHKLWIAQHSHGTEEILRLSRRQGVPVEFVSRHVLDLKVRGHHQGVVAQAAAAEYLELDQYIRSLGTVPNERFICVVALDEIQDPHNIGAILRSAGFFGVSAAIVPRWRSAPVGETAARVSSGAIEHIPLIRVRNLADALIDLKDAGFEVIGADMAGESLGSDPMFTKGSDPGRSRIALVFGSEGKGLRRLVKDRCDKLLKVPGKGPVASLNVAAAAAIFLYEFCRCSSTGRATPL
jgi:23S rRNA (guanosine2251-2'-O)-methyltransferase